MLDRDLAALYEVETKALNLAVRRNLKRFPPDFMFQLTKEEFDGLRFQIEALEKGNPLSLQIETLKPSRGQHSKCLPYAFTEQGIAMLSGVLNSDKAINMNIAIMRAFVGAGKKHDTQLNDIYDAMENVRDERAAQRKWDARERIGFKVI